MLKILKMFFVLISVGPFLLADFFFGFAIQNLIYYWETIYYSIISLIANEILMKLSIWEGDM